MEQLTVKDLYLELDRLVKQGMGDKKIIIADDIEGNHYHGCFFSCISEPSEVNDCITVSSGLFETQETNPDNLVIIG